MKDRVSVNDSAPAAVAHRNMLIRTKGMYLLNMAGLLSLSQMTIALKERTAMSKIRGWDS
ncbi:MAG: hypothetical protein WCI27_06950 [Candidatus Omnitrophota bacterium]